MILPWNKLGGGGGLQQSSVRGGKECPAENTYIFQILNFLVLCLCNNNDYVPIILETESGFGRVLYSRSVYGSNTGFPYKSSVKTR